MSEQPNDPLGTPPQNSPGEPGGATPPPGGAGDPGGATPPPPPPPGAGEPGGATPPPPPPGAGEPTKDERNLALVAHLLGIVLSVVGPLIIWIIKKDESPFVEDQAKEAMNFQIIPLIVYVLGAALSCLILPPILALILWVVVVVLAIMAAMKASEGVRYRYPFALRLIK